MSERERCAVCDFPLATGDDFDGEDDGALCWSAIGGTAHRGPRIDWRARALAAAGALDVLEDKYAVLRHSNDAAEARVEALDGALRVADYRLGEVSNYLGPFDHALMFRALSETIAQVRAALSATPPKPAPEVVQCSMCQRGQPCGALPAPRPDATEALRVAREALTDAVELLSHADFKNGNVHAGVDEGEVLADRWVQRIRAALEMLRAHVEPTPLEIAVQAHTEKETP